MGVIFAISFEGKPQAEVANNDATVATIDYAEALGWVLPLTAAVFVLFQIYVPIGSGLLNVNLADPVVILGGSLFVLRAVGKRQWPQWRVSHVNLFTLLATLALSYALLLGAWRFGWTNWALINRFLGWFILLAYAATGALITSLGGIRGLRALAMTYAGALIGVLTIEFVLLLMGALGVSVEGLVRLDEIEGFSQNHNFLTFQMLIGVSALLAFVRPGAWKQIFAGLILVGFWFAGSRSGSIAILCTVAAAVYIRCLSAREALGALACAVSAAVVLAAVPLLMTQLGFGHGHAAIVPQLDRTEASLNERTATLVGGWKLFVEHPIFGAGLGAFRNENVVSSSRIPLVIHSTALWLLAELGLVGFLIFALPAFYVWALEWWRRATYDRASGLVALCILGFAIMSGPADMVYQRTFWLLIGAALAAPLIASDDASEEGQEAQLTVRQSSSGRPDAVTLR